MTGNEWLAIGPFIVVIALALLIVLADMIWPKRDNLISGIAIIGVLAAMALTVVAGPLGAVGLLPAAGQEVFHGVYVRDQLTAFLDLTFLSIALLTLLFAPDYLRPRGLPMAEFSGHAAVRDQRRDAAGAGRDLLILFLGLELMVLPGYMLAGYAKRDGLSTEGAIKYFLLGSFSSAIFLFGLAFTFGFLGTTNIHDIAQALQQFAAGEQVGHTLPAGLVMGLALLTTGVAFKIAAVPFHYWTPDAYQGSPTPVTGYLSVGPKIGAFALILRLFVEALGPLRGDWVLAIGVLAAVTMTVGNLSALGAGQHQADAGLQLDRAHRLHPGRPGGLRRGQRSDRAGGRHPGRALLRRRVHVHEPGRVRGGRGAPAAARRHQPDRHLRRPRAQSARLGPADDAVHALADGIPPTAGFFGKALILLSAVQAGGWLSVLAVIMMINAAAAAFYYLRVVVFMYMREAPANARPVILGGFTRAGLVIAAVATIAIGVVPNVVIGVYDAALRAATALMGGA